MSGISAVIPEKFEECPNCGNEDRQSWLYDFQQCVVCGYNGMTAVVTEDRDDLLAMADANAKMLSDQATELYRLREINAELLAALKTIAEHQRITADIVTANNMQEIARAAIAKAEAQ